MSAEEQYRVRRTALRFLGRRPARLQFRWKWAASRMKQPRITSCRIRADLRRARPVFILDGEREEFAM